MQYFWSCSSVDYINHGVRVSTLRHISESCSGYRKLLSTFGQYKSSDFSLEENGTPTRQTEGRFLYVLHLAFAHAKCLCSISHLKIFCFRMFSLRKTVVSYSGKPMNTAITSSISESLLVTACTWYGMYGIFRKVEERCSVAIHLKCDIACFPDTHPTGYNSAEVLQKSQ